MREISVAEGMTVDEYLQYVAPELKPLVARIRQQKIEGRRIMPSQTLIDRSRLLNSSQRNRLLDRTAALVDENCCGRSDMCSQFAQLLQQALVHLGLPARVVTGSVTYYNDAGRTVFRWPPDGHHWVAIDDELIDGNTDSLVENPVVTAGLKLRPYWGPKIDAPKDRKFHENSGARRLPKDTDVENIWWPELRDWLEEEFHQQSS